jgi:hypothetical protein
MSKLDKDQVIAAYTEAYSAVNGKAPIIEAKGGWYNVDGGKNIRLADLNAMIAEIAPAKEVKVAVDKLEKVSQKKPSTKPTIKKVKKSDFSVKAFWAKRVLEQSSLSKLPR